MATIEYHCQSCSTKTSEDPRPWLSASHPLRGGTMVRSLAITCRQCGQSLKLPIMEDLPGVLARSGWTFRFS